MVETNEQPIIRFAVLLGAGASINAGIPDMVGFTALFKDELKKKDFALYRSANVILSSFQQEKEPDLEDLMVALEILTRSTPYEAILDRIRPMSPNSLEELKNADKLRNTLHEFIAQKTFINDVSKIQYLSGFADLIRDYGSIPIFTVNYDTTIELMCERNGFGYVDGFDPYWNPRVFEDDKKIKIHKLHGSCTWYSAGATYLKLPICPTTSHIELLGAGKTKTMVVYPAPIKNRMAEPLAVLTNEFRKTLYNCDVLFIIGYSCRDEEISLIFAEALRVNPKIRFYIVNPNPFTAIQNLAKVDEKLGNACIGLTINWEAFLENNLFGRLIRSLVIGTLGFSEFRNNSRYGKYYFQPNSQYHNFEEELRMSFHLHFLGELHKWIKEQFGSTTVDKGLYGQLYDMLFEVSIGLIYNAILMKKNKAISIYANDIMSWLDNNMAEKDPDRRYLSEVEKLPKIISYEQWTLNSNPSYDINGALKYRIKKWAEWIRPFISNDIFENNLQKIANSISYSSEDYELQNNFRSYFQQNRNDSYYVQRTMELKRNVRQVTGRIPDSPRFDEIKEYREQFDQKPGTSDQYLWSKYNNWIIAIYQDMISQYKTIGDTLQSLRDKENI